MARRQKVVVGNIAFPTKSAASQYIREIVARYGDEESLSPVDFRFVLELITNHPQSDTKIGPGVRRIIVRRNPVWRNTRGFHLFRIDNTDTDISWTECLSPTPHIRKVLSALRVLVEPQTLAFKQHYFDSGKSTCELTGDPIAFVGSHVDHAPPLTFHRLAHEFAESRSVNLESLPLADELADNKYFDVLADSEIASDWQEYHRNHALLRVVSAAANLTQ